MNWDSPKEQSSEELAKILSDYFRNNAGWVCKLHGPKSITVKRRNGDYRKVNHIEGNFTPVSAYVGSKKGVIVVFKPKEPTEYVTMEMPLKEANNEMEGFENIISHLAFGNQQQAPQAHNYATNPLDNPVFSSW